MHTDFIVHEKYTTFWLNRCVRVYFVMYVPDFLKIIFFCVCKKYACCEAPKAKPSTYLDTKQVLRGIFFTNPAHTNQNVT